MTCQHLLVYTESIKSSIITCGPRKFSDTSSLNSIQFPNLSFLSSNLPSQSIDLHHHHIHTQLSLFPNYLATAVSQAMDNLFSTRLSSSYSSSSPRQHPRCACSSSCQRQHPRYASPCSSSSQRRRPRYACNMTFPHQRLQLVWPGLLWHLGPLFLVDSISNVTKTRDDWCPAILTIERKCSSKDWEC